MQRLNRSIQYIYIGCGWFFVGLGLIGIFLPILPTTPFILVAAFFFAKSSPRWHHWLRTSNLFGKIVRDWEKNHSVAFKTKLIASIIMFIVFSLSLMVVNPAFWIKLIILSLGLAVLLYLWTRPTTPGFLHTNTDEQNIN